MDGKLKIDGGTENKQVFLKEKWNTVGESWKNALEKKSVRNI